MLVSCINKTMQVLIQHGDYVNKTIRAIGNTDYLRPGKTLISGFDLGSGITFDFDTPLLYIGSTNDPKHRRVLLFREMGAVDNGVYYAFYQHNNHDLSWGKEDNLYELSVMGLILGSWKKPVDPVPVNDQIDVFDVLEGRV